MMDIERSNYLIGDLERESALNLLKSATESGHLSLAEFDRRACLAATSTTQADIERLTADIPQQLVVKTNRTSGLQKRIGIFFLWLCMIPFTGLFNGEMTAMVAILALPLAIALFILKVGPDSWYEPKTVYRQIEGPQH